MQSENSPSAFLWFAAFVVVALAGNAYFWFGKNPHDKRQLFPWFSLLVAVIIVGFLYFGVQAHLPVVVACAAFVAIISVVNARLTAFCPRCARLIRRGLLSARVDYCPRCGVHLDATLPPHGGA